LTEKLSAILTPAYFYRARVLPLGYQDCILRGSGSALDALFIAEYLRAVHAVPLPEELRRYAGALSGAERHGVFSHVCHCDVRSLYPSLLLMFQEKPVRDELGIFLKLLGNLRTFRLAAKDKMRQLPPGVERDQTEALQSSFKVLINSFYGYLGFAQGCFNDYALAEKVTAAGRELLCKLTARLSELGAVVIEMDTDGIYFQFPDGAGADFASQVTAVLPDGIDLEFDACYPAMFSYKAKNYALLNSDCSVELTGAALKSRALEPFQRKFILQAVT
jgi:DNA polymerase elongation subunit (family B)